MRIRTDLHDPRHRHEPHHGLVHGLLNGTGAALWLALLLVLGLAVAAPVAAQEPAQEPTAVGEETATAGADALREALEERYRAYPALDGVLLVPRQEMPGIRAIQVAPGEVAINGELVSPAILRSWLGAEAEPLLALAALDAEGVRTLLPLEEEPPGEGAAPGAPGTGEEGAGEEEAGDEAGGEVADEAAGEDLPPAPPAPPAPPEEPRVQLGQQFKMGNDIVIAEDETATEAVALGSSIRVRGKVRRDVVAIGGNVQVSGEVGGEVVAILGNVALGPDAVVRGNVMALGGDIERAPGARVDGDLSEINGPYVRLGDFEWDDGYGGRDFVRGWRIEEAYWNLVGTVLLGLLACLALLVAGGVVERVESRIRSASDFLVAGLVGLAVLLLLGPVLLIVTLLLVITIVGCLALPLIPFALLALLVAALFGYAGVALRVGRWCETRFGWSFASPYLAVLVGVALIEIWRLVGEGLQIFGGPAWFFAMMFIVLGVLVEFVAWSVALGAILMNMVDRSSRRPPAHPGALPPAPGGTGAPGAPGTPGAPVSPGPAGAAAGGPAGPPPAGPPPAPPSPSPSEPAPSEPSPPEPSPSEPAPPPPGESPAGGDGAEEPGSGRREP